jgi:hypothetical protein
MRHKTTSATVMGHDQMTVRIHKTTAGVMFGFWWVTQPIVVAVFYRTELFRGAYPTDADSIGIPIFGFAIIWALLTPLVAWTLWRGLRQAPEHSSLLAFDRMRPVAATAWSVGFAIMILEEFQSGISALGSGHPEKVLSGLIGVVSAVALRAVLCGPRLERNATQQPAV